MAFLMGTATDLPARGFAIDNRSRADVLLGSIRRWDKVISSAQH